MSIEVSTTSRPSAVVVAVTGDIDAYTAADVESGIQDAFADSADHLILDLTSTTFIDSTALGVFVGINKRLKSAGRAFSIVCPDQRLLRIFRITRLDSVWPLFDTLDEAEAAHRD